MGTAAQITLNSIQSNQPFDDIMHTGVGKLDNVFWLYRKKQAGVNGTLNVNKLRKKKWNNWEIWDLRVAHHTCYTFST